MTKKIEDEGLKRTVSLASMGFASERGVAINILSDKSKLKESKNSANSASTAANDSSHNSKQKMTGSGNSTDVKDKIKWEDEPDNDDIPVVKMSKIAQFKENLKSGWNKENNQKQQI